MNFDFLIFDILHIIFWYHFKSSKKGYDKNGANGWLCYLNKGACSNNGLYISQSLLEKIRDDYNQLYKEYKSDVKKLKDNGIKIKYKKLDMS